MDATMCRDGVIPDSLMAFLRREASVAGLGEMQIAAYVARVELEFSDAEVSRSLGISRGRIKTALGAVEERREKAEFDEWVDGLAARAREMLH